MSPEARQRAQGVRLMLFDVDGVLTDGTLYLSAQGEVMKGFNVRDGHGLKMLQQAGIEVGIVSSRNSPIVAVRCAELGIKLVEQGAQSKRSVVGQLLAARSLAPEQAGFMGDDLLDLPAMIHCGFSATVPEAPEAVRERAHYVTRSAGGRGAAREVCELLLEARGRLEQAVRDHLKP
jgi:3-deoxy-D-manno-octulosonate 8-phosphate phosphatase (KDO 8-P phosphatase)